MLQRISMIHEMCVIYVFLDNIGKLFTKFPETPYSLQFHWIDILTAFVKWLPHICAKVLIAEYDSKPSKSGLGNGLSSICENNKES